MKYQVSFVYDPEASVVTDVEQTTLKESVQEEVDFKVTKEELKLIAAALYEISNANFWVDEEGTLLKTSQHGFSACSETYYRIIDQLEGDEYGVWYEEFFKEYLTRLKECVTNES